MTTTYSSSGNGPTSRPLKCSAYPNTVCWHTSTKETDKMASYLARFEARRALKAVIDKLSPEEVEHSQIEDKILAVWANPEAGDEVVDLINTVINHKLGPVAHPGLDALEDALLEADMWVESGNALKQSLMEIKASTKGGEE